MDHDAHPHSMISTNIIELMKRDDFVMAGPDLVVIDRSGALEGLAELTQFWLQTRKFQANPDFYHNHIQLTTEEKNAGLVYLDSDNWDHAVIPAFFNFISIPFWFREDVQDYLTAVLRSGADLTQRWLEQGPQNMIRQLFSNSSQFLFLGDIKHGVKDESFCYDYVPQAN